MKRITLGIIAGILAIALLVSFMPTRSSDIAYFSSTSELESFLAQSAQEEKTALYRASESLQGSDNGAGSAESAPTPAMADSEGSYSTTNIQVQGVDEPDFVKNDGTYVYIGRDNLITIALASPAEEAQVVSSTRIEGYITSIFLNGDQLIVFGVEEGSYGCLACLRPAVSDESITSDVEEKRIAADYTYTPPRSFVFIYDVSDRTQPVLQKEFFYEGSYRDARMVGDYVYLIAHQSLIKEGDDLVMPALGYAGAEKPLIASDIAYFPGQLYGYDLTTIIAFELDDLEREPTSSSFLTGYTQTIYMSEENIYLTMPKQVPYELYEERMTEEVILPSLEGDARSKAEEILSGSESFYEKQAALQNLLGEYYNALSADGKASLEEELADRMNEFEETWQREMQRTTIHKISVDADEISYVGKTDVPGYLLNQFSLDEHEGYLRVATTLDLGGGWGMPIPFMVRGVGGATADDPTSTIEPVAVDGSEETPREEIPETELSAPETFPAPTLRDPASTNLLTVLDADLNTVGTLDDLAEGERIYSVRFMGDRAYMVTFKQVDPLFVIDLSDPTDPRVMGELKIPGYSTYLHPFDETTLIGIGQDSDGEVEEGSITAVIPAGVKIGLFDVSDPSAPREIDHLIVGDRGSYSDALYDHKAFLFDPATGQLVIPMTIQERVSGGVSEWGWYPTTTTFQGAYVLQLSRESGIELQGTLTHLSTKERIELEQAKADGTSYYYPPYDAQIQRSIFIGTTLYTLSQRALEAHDRASLTPLASVALPRPVYDYETPGSDQSSPGFAGENDDDVDA